MGGVRRVSEAARALMAKRIQGRISREELHMIFAKAKIQHLDKTANDLVARLDKIGPGPDLDEAVQYVWADEMMKRFNEILDRRCN
jgi:5-methylcytosine-specific restriction endonuclease McrBC regulatory subunit McrC